MPNTPANILITGATGYVGGHLVHKLENSSYNIRCIARNPNFLKDKFASNVEILKADALDYESLLAALEDIDTAFYLIHSMGSKEPFKKLDQIAAENFAKAAKSRGVKRIIYLGGLGKGDNLSNHLSSRQEVGKILKTSNAQIIEFRASIIIGPGSLSFELVRNLSERLPVLLTPKWAYNLAQPIYIDDVINYLTLAIDIDIAHNQIFEIGGADYVSYGGIIYEYARQRNLKRLIIPVPFLTPYLSSLWLGLITPIYARVGKKLIESVKNPTVVKDKKALKIFNIKPIGISEAVEKALYFETNHIDTTHWSDAISSSGCTTDYCLNIKVHNRLVNRYKITIKADHKKSFWPIQIIGGHNGWYYANFLWQIRGFIDIIMGGPGIRRGRKHDEHIFIGDAIDWWRVENYKPDKLLRLYSEMKLPGEGWLEFEVNESNNNSELSVSAIFYPKGLLGLTYWYLFYPFHWIIFNGMTHKIKNIVENNH